MSVIRFSISLQIPSNYFVAGQRQLECVKINLLGVEKKKGSLEWVVCIYLHVML